MNLFLAITGASGAIYPKIFLDFCKTEPDIKLHVAATANAHRIFQEELGLKLSDYQAELHNDRDFDVPYVSGSAKLDAMVVLPCSMGMIGRMASGVSDCAITRAADTFLKERRKLILVPRETPYNLIHLRNMTTLTEAGAIILPATPSFYGGQKTIEDVAKTVIARLLDHLNIKNSLTKRWMDATS
jgi:4-hydroxy-3-polyprenylbenzoate decarboxylase